jgi:ABC-type multidrug transport system fused ATPase/permease subunit
MKIKFFIGCIFLTLVGCATVRQVDQIIYMEKGQIKAVGSFEEVRRLVPNFDTQASLMGL